MAEYEAYTWVDRQVGKRGHWQRLRLAELPFPPLVDDKVTMQRFRSATPQDGEPHKASFVLDFDAHAEWLHLDHCLNEVRRFLSAWEARWGVPSDLLHVAFSGRAGFHVTIPALLLDDAASPHLTTAYRRWATQIKDTLGLITLDAPSRCGPDWWYPRIEQALGYLPAQVQDVDAFRLWLRRVGIYTRRRMIRRENSQHPQSGLFKISLLPAELADGMAAICALAGHPRFLPARLAPPTHPGLPSICAICWYRSAYRTSSARSVILAAATLATDCWTRHCPLIPTHRFASSASSRGPLRTAVAICRCSRFWPIGGRLE